VRPALAVDAPVNRLTYLPDGQTLAAGAGRGVRRWNTTTGAELPRLVFSDPETVEDVMALACAPDGTLLAAASRDGVLAWWDAAGRRLGEWRSPGFYFSAHTLAFAPDGRHLAVGNANGTVYLLRLK
jgi:WD40 repeat protein